MCSTTSVHQIYGQRDRIFVKEDLSEDVQEMLEQEVELRVETGLVDEEGPWKLIAWLEQVQPPFMTREQALPELRTVPAARRT